MAKKLTKSKARKILHDKEVHGHPLTEQQRKFFGAIAGGAEPYKAQIGTKLTSLPSNYMKTLSEALGFPQKAVTKMITGKYQTPSEAMGITNPIGAFATDAVLDPVNLLLGAGSAKAASKVSKVATKPKIFKSEIDWAKWNPDTPKYPELINEYNAIEEVTKKAGTWMKNSDGSPFRGTPEQFIQQQSSHFKKAFPKGFEKTYRGGNNDPLLNREHPIVFTGDYNTGLHYTGMPSQAQVATPQNKAGRALFDLYLPKNDNAIVINNQGRSWREIPRRYFGDNPPEHDSYRFPDIPEGYTSTDDIAKWMVKNDKEYVKINKIFDSHDADHVTIVNQKPGNYLKSAVGNVGFFDMTNPNIYKAMVPTVIGTSLLQQNENPPKKKQNGGWLDKFDMPQAQNGIEGTMGGLTDVGFNYNGAWGGTMQMGGVLPGAVGFTYARTAGAAPANGPYAKKTKASAQDGEEVMKGREFVEKWMNSPMYKQMLEKSAQGPELERISKGRIAGLNVPTITSTAFDLAGTNTMGTQKHRIRTMLNATFPEREEMMRVLQTAVDNPKNKEAKRKAQEIMQPTITGWDIGLNPILKPGSHDYESVLAHEHGHTTDAPFIGGDLHKMSLEQLKNAKVNLQKLYIPESDVEKMRKYQEGKVTTDYGKYISRPEETRQFLNQVRYLGKTQGVYDPFTQKITPEQYKKIKPLQNTDPMGSLREIYTDEQIIDMLNSISKRQNVFDRVPTAQNGQEMKYYQEGLDFKPKTISQDGSDIPVDPEGYWNPENVGNPVIIPSNIITMEGVNQPLLGISDTGDVQYMEPGEDYEFDGEYVTEYPVAQGGKRVPITVSDPKDPRLKAYQDSLSLHKLGEAELRRFFDGDPGESRGKIRSLQDLNKSTKTYSGEIPKNQLYNTDRDALNSNRNVQKISNIYNRTGILPTEFWANEGFLNYRFKKPVQPVEYRKPEPKQEVVNKPEPVVEKKAPLTDYFQGTPVYAPTPYHGSGAGAFVGYRTPQGDTVFVKPEDYERMAVPKYGREFIESKKKMKNGGVSVNNADAQPLKKLDQLLNFTNYNKPTKGGWLDKYN